MASSFPFPAVPVFGERECQGEPGVKGDRSVEGHTLLSLESLDEPCGPEEKSCSRCWSVSSLFRNLRYTVSPAPFMSQRALFSLTMMCPVLHLGQVNVRAAAAGRLRFRISRGSLAGVVRDGCHERVRSERVPLYLSRVFSQLPVRETSATSMSFTAS